jgi:hypothetical protein
MASGVGDDLCKHGRKHNRCFDVEQSGDFLRVVSGPKQGRRPAHVVRGKNNRSFAPEAGLPDELAELFR